MRVVEEFGKTVDEAREKAFKALGIKSANDDGVDVEVLDEGSPGNALGWGRKFARVKVTLRGGVEESDAIAPVAESTEAAEVDPIPEPELADREHVPSARGSRRTSPSSGEESAPRRKPSGDSAARPSSEKAPSTRGASSTAGHKDGAPARKGEKPVDRPKKIEVDEDEEDLGEDLDFEEEARDVLEEILDLMRLHVNVEEEEAADGQPVLNIVGPDQGILIGKHGQTLDALQFVVNLIVNKETQERRRITLDAGGYRLRREKTLKDLAWRMARRALDDRCQIALEPMGAAERRIIHLALADDPDIETFSEGEEPMRKVIISPRR